MQCNKMNNSENEYKEWEAWIEKRVCVKGTMFGTLKYFGKTYFSSGLWCGIALDNPCGKNNGMVNNRKYFTCQPNFGIFVPHSKVTKIEDVLAKNITICETNKTFEIKGNDADEMETGLDLEQRDPCHDWTDINVQITKDKLINSRIDSEESLGILNSDLIDDIDTELFLAEVSNEHLKNETLDDSVFLVPALPKINENLFPDPKYASTPRNPAKQKCVDLEDSLKQDLMLVDEVNEIKTFKLSDPESEINFDLYKLKLNPNLSSTSKSEIEISSSNLKFNITHSDTLENISDSNILNKIDLPSNQNINADIKHNFNRTFQFSETANCKLNSTIDLNSTINFGNKEWVQENGKLPNKNLNETINFGDKVSPQEIVKVPNNLNATFELKQGILSLVSDENKNSTFDFKTKEIISCNKINTSYSINSNKNNEVIEKQGILHLISDEHKNSTFDLKTNENINCKKINTSYSITSNKNKEIFENTFVLNSNPVNEYRSLSETSSKDISEQNFEKESSTDIVTADKFNENTLFDKSRKNSLPVTKSEKSRKRISLGKIMDSTFQKLENNTINNNKVESKSQKIVNSNVENKAKNINAGIKKPLISKSIYHPKHISKFNLNPGSETFISEPNVLKEKNDSPRIKFKSKILEKAEKKPLRRSMDALKQSNSLKQADVHNLLNNVNNNSTNLSSNTKIHKGTNHQNVNLRQNGYSKTVPINKLSEFSDVPKHTVHPFCRSTNLPTLPEEIENSPVIEAFKGSKSSVKIPTFSDFKFDKNVNNSGFNAHTAENLFVDQPKSSRRSSMIISSKGKLPVGIIKPRYSILPSTIDNRKKTSNPRISLPSANIKISSIKQSLPISKNIPSAAQSVDSSSNKNLIGSRNPSRKSMITTNAKLRIQPPSIKKKC